ncbi:MAG: S1 RNA-binding domain-containing protein [Planctomycetota bacterium]|nr:S1 RNA-binding domain-containing protein [Planctomycetota bacterium]
MKGTLEPGQVVDGTVRKIMDFGAFVDIGGIDGLLHISDLSHERVAKVEDVVKEGDSVRVKILKIDWDKNRISLGMKQTAPDPWQSVGESVPVGEIVSGRVTKLLEFGAFVEVAPGLEGLVHISELAWKRVATVDSVLKADQVVKVKVLEVDPGKKRISLSVKQTTEAPANMRKGKGEDQRTEEEIRQETPAQRRMREKFQSRGKSEGLKSGLGDVGALGQGLGGLSLEKFKGG